MKCFFIIEIVPIIAVHDKMLEGIMQSTCEKALIVEQYPRTSIIVTVQEMQDRGNVCMVNFFTKLFMYVSIYVFSYYLRA